MLEALKDLFHALTAPVEQASQARGHALKLAVAVPRVEVMGADPVSQAALVSLREKFALQDGELVHPRRVHRRQATGQGSGPPGLKAP